MIITRGMKDILGACCANFAGHSHGNTTLELRSHTSELRPFVTHHIEGRLVPTRAIGGAGTISHATDSFNTANASRLRNGNGCGGGGDRGN